jgi:hypothetical protein
MNQGKSVGTVQILNAEVIPRPNFIDYLRSGWFINTSIGIDYTASNGEL